MRRGWVRHVMRMTRTLVAASIALAFSIAACESRRHEGPAERAGEKVDQGAKKLGEKMEEGGQKLQEKARGD